MELVKLNCGGCGAPLEVSPRASFVTCAFCKVQLSVKQKGNAHWTEALEDVREKLEKLELRTELMALERDWEEERKRHMVEGRHGKLEEPQEAASFIMPVIGLFVGLTVAIMFLVAGQPALSSLGFVFMIMCFFMGSGEGRKAADFKKAKQAHARRKRALLDRIEQGSS